MIPMTTAHGRGGWTKVGMPANGTGYYQLLRPVNVGSQPSVDDAHRAVMYGVKALQVRINELGYMPKLVTDGWYGPNSNGGMIWAQKKLGVVADGQCGPKTATAMFWPLIKEVAPATVAHSVGGICAHESMFDPGAVGYEDADDIGLVQINGPANPTLTEAERFDARLAFTYCGARLQAALNTYHNIDYAIASYAVPQWAVTWSQTGKPPNAAASAYVDYVKAWTPPS